MTKRENLIKLFHGELPEWIPESGADMMLIGASLLDLERPHWKAGTDWFGVQWLLQTMPSSAITHPDIHQPPVLPDIADWKNLRFPDLEAIPWEKHAAQCAVEWNDLNGRMPFFMLEHGAFERLTLLMGFENSLIALMEDPDACREYAEAMADFKIRIFDHFMELAPYDLVIYQDDLGSATGPLMSPATYRQIFKEPLRRISAHVRSRGVLFGYHSCGKMENFMEDLLDIGIDLVNPLQGCNRQAEFKRLYGDRTVICGGLNNQEITDIPEPNEEDLRKELQRAVSTLAPGGRFILEIPMRNNAVNGVDTPGILHDEFAKIANSFYQ